ncbi:hypothetical protein BH11PSE11_BH11PSE11_36510 [soil metagenome]
MTGKSTPSKAVGSDAIKAGEHQTFFAHLLADVTEPTAPFGISGLPDQDAAIDEATRELGSDLPQELSRCAHKMGVNPTAIVHVAWSQVLCLVSGRPDVVFGTALFADAREESEVSDSQVNILPVRLAVTDQGTAASVLQMDVLLTNLGQLVGASLDSAQACSGVEPSLPLCSTILTYRNAPEAVRKNSGLPRTGKPADFLLEMTVAHVVKGSGEQLSLHARAKTSKLAPRLAERFCDYLEAALERLLETLEHAPHTPLRNIDILPAAERQQLLDEFNATDYPYPRERSLQDLFEAQVARSPQSIAVVQDDTALTYGELNTRANQLAHFLTRAKIGSGDYVAIAMERSADLVVAQLAVLKAGAAYVPLSDVLPLPRQALMLEECGASAILTRQSATVPANFSRLNIDDPAITDCPATNPPASCDGSASAYVMYTSGSTGRPKGVEVPHHAVARLVINNGYADFNAADRVAFASNPAFDASTMEVWAPLLNGGTVVVVDQATLLDPNRFAAKLEQQAVTVLWLTVGLFNQYASALAGVIPKLRYLLVGGDKLDPKVIAQVLHNNPPQHLLNGYGPTETTTFALTYEIKSVETGARSVPIGHPIGNTQVYVLDARHKLVPVGVPGEIYIGGDGVARGYRNRPDLTAERFLPNPFKPGSGECMYKTGDLGYWHADGKLEYLGRNDLQVKIRGFRIETGEIENVLSGHADVKDCAVIARKAGDGELRLVAYVDAAAPAPGVSVLREYLAQHLPEFMVPSAFVFMPALPLTVNGKLDKAALPAPGQDRPELAQAYLAPLNDDEGLICALFGEQLSIDRVGRLDNFFELGGNSIAVARLAVRITERTGTLLSPALIFNQPTPAGVANALKHASGTAKGDAASDATQARRRAGYRAGYRKNASNGDAIAIIAISGRFPGAGDTDTLWRNLRAGEESITRFSDEQLDPSISAELRNDPDYVKARALIDDVDKFDASFFGISPREAEVMDPQQRIFMELCWDCLERGGYAPDAIDTPVGVFGGMHVASYFQHHVRSHPEAIRRVGDLAVMLGNEKDYFTTRVAYRLNLTGPAISINTACSTSLVAVAQAVGSLRAGQCSMALAGGVSVTCPPNSGYLYQEEAILSPDGHTRTFDADAKGTVFADGAGVVLLKRLADAQADGDPILAVIRGVAINNDGGERASFTAPSVDGQAAVVAAALDDAQISASDISYVEAHGTATPIGDPIEIEALTRAYRHHTDAKAFCRVGSVKSNLGHLITAAGVTGLIKTVMSLQNEEIPPSLHYRAPNPSIAFDHSPFVVNHALSAWPRSEVPRRAGVSAFGFGGTNANVIVEEAPVETASQQGNPPHLLLLSARTSTSLAGNVARLADHLESHPQINLADAAYTLRTGRKAMAERICVVADDLGQAISVLRTDSSPLKAKGKTGERNPDVIFMFPGQSAQYAAMGSALYAGEPAFRTAFDACLKALEGVTAFDMKEQLFSGDAAALTGTAVTQPALFCMEYALASYWMSLGVQPAAMIGHSVGEFVAAAIAGVFTLEDAVRLVARRGQLMQALPSGAMLAVRLPAAQLQSRLPAGVSLAAENSPAMSVAAGAADEIDALHRMLEAEGVSTRPLQTSHAFHSAMMDPAVALFEEELRKCKLSAPRVAIYSTVTARVLSAEEACDPGYWARHLRETVRFSPALMTLTQNVPGILLEVGPRATLATLARQHAKPGQPGSTAVQSLADSPENELSSLRLATGRLWTEGVSLQLETLDLRTQKRKVTLPGYAFERTRHWLDTRPAATAPAAEAPTALASSLRHTTMQPMRLPQLNFPPTSPISIENAMPQSTTQDRIPRLTAQLRSMLEDTSGVDLSDAPPSTTFVELGLDSLTLTQVAIQLKQTFKVNITFRQIMANYRSLDTLAAYLDEQLPADAPAAAVPVQAGPGQTPDFAFAPAALSATGGAPNSMVQQVIQQQMLIMSQQLALLQGAPMAAAAAPSAPAFSEPSSAAAPQNAPGKPAAIAAAADDPAEVKGSIKYDVKKAFGAIARIHTEPGSGISERQRARFDAFTRRYVERTRQSKEFTQANRAKLADPRVVNGFRPMFKEIVYQIVVNRSKGSKVWDLDGNEYVDVINGFGMNMFGWQPQFVVDAVKKQMDLGYEIGPLHPMAADVADLICELTGHDRAGLCNTGSEAVMGAMRIARTITGRNLIVMFSGSYHGIFDEVIVRATKRLRPVPAAPGILPNTTENVIVLDYGTPESLEIIRSCADEIAAVLIESVQSRRPDFQPVDYLREVRAITEKSGSVFIFDEVITGFRSSLGGIQEVFGIRADLCCYGKVIGGGFPIGVIAGKREFMDALDGGWWQFGDDSTPTVGVTYFAGTFVRHPLALAATKASLEHMKEAGPQLQVRLNKLTQDMVDELNVFCREVGVPLEVRTFTSLWKIFFLEDHPMQDLLFAMMRSRGIHIIDHFPCFMTTAHTADDIRKIVTAMKESIIEMQESEFLPKRADAAAKVFDATRPPVRDARLGKDPQGNPAWFVPDANAPGKYCRIDA